MGDGRWTSSIGGAQRQFGANDRLQSRFLRGEMEPRRAIHAVAIEERERRVAERRGAIDERLGQRRAVEKGKGGGGVELGVWHGVGAKGAKGAGAKGAVRQSYRPSRNHRWVVRS